MRGLRTIRIILSIFFFIATVAFLMVSPVAHNPVVRIAARVQIVPSAIASGMGVIIVWLGITFLFGRIYCSSVCPLGTLQDFIIPVRRWIKPLSKPFRYHSPNIMRYNILIIYVITLIAGAALVCMWIEPWKIITNICGAIQPSSAEATWLTLGIGVSTGIASGIASGVLIALCALLTGRGFCSEICPVGTALGSFHEFTIFHIEIDPDKCINCMRCEEVCKSSCVKVIGRVVDNSRCVRCFDCLEVCPNDAIHFQPNRNRPVTPLFRRLNRNAAK
ncbi:MAG: 4Fe-4S binding protein [Bacteroides sp.]|nr:4Fe-4S binding protein [Bacteroides sp.]